MSMSFCCRSCGRAVFVRGSLTPLPAALQTCIFCERDSDKRFQEAAAPAGLADDEETASEVGPIALRAALVGNRAAIELNAMRARVGTTDDESEQEATQWLTAGSEDAKSAWIRDGLIIDSMQLAEAWNCSRQAVEQARERGELCSLKFQGLNWYPAVMTLVSPADVGQVTAAMQPLDAVSQVIFWNRQHGSLGGLTVAQAIVAGTLIDVMRLAQSCASER